MRRQFIFPVALALAATLPVLAQRGQECGQAASSLLRAPSSRSFHSGVIFYPLWPRPASSGILPGVLLLGAGCI